MLITNWLQILDILIMLWIFAAIGCSQLILITIYLFCYTIKIISLIVYNLPLLTFVIYLTVFLINILLNIIFMTLEKKPIKLYF